MFKLRDFQHLPQLDGLIQQVVHDGPGLTVVSGLDPRPAARSSSGMFLPSGRSVIFDILLHEVMTAKTSLKAVYVARDKSAARPPRPLKQRLKLTLVESPPTYEELIVTAASQGAGLVVIDHLSAENIRPALEVARRGVRVLAQLDSVLRGAGVARQLADLGGGPQGELEGLSWILSVYRLATLCSNCKLPTQPTPEQIGRFTGLYPHLAPLVAEMLSNEGGGSKEMAFYSASECSKCRFTGRTGDIAAFDVFQAGPEPPKLFERPSQLPLEEYMLRLAAQGHLAMDDLIGLEANQLRRTYHLLASSEAALREANLQLNSKLVELEAANRVLLQRTEVLISLQDLGHALITSAALDDLAKRVCKRAGELCGADRAILYYFTPGGEDEDQVEVLGVNGWPASLMHRKLVISHNERWMGAEARNPIPFAHWPPGVAEDNKTTLQAGLWVPLVAQDHQVGLMIVHSTHKPRFTPGESALLQTFANQAALAIQRAGLVDELRAKIEQLEAAQVELVKKERLDRELELARQVQQGVLPRTFPHAPGYSFAALNEPARQVGGDFYDVFSPHPDTIGIVIGDVSDKGMPAALYMALTRSLLLAEARRERSPRQVLISVNHLLQELGEPTSFVTVFYGLIEKSTRKLTYARAGHDHPMLLHAGKLEQLGGKGAVLGVLEEYELQLTEEQLELQPGDCLVLYTDGLIDVMDAGGIFFGLDRLEALLLAHSGLPSEDLCRSIFKELAAFQGSAEQFDDMTLLVVEVEDQQS